MRDRLIELLKAADKRCGDTRQCENCVGFGHGGECVNYLIADHLLANGVVVPPDELYSIIDKGTIYATVSKAMVDWLPLYIIENPKKYGYYKTREEAEQALKGGE